MAGDKNPDDEVTEQTREAEATEARAEHRSDREPTDEEAADAPTTVDPKVAAAIEQADKTGANVKGEGQIP